MVHSPYMSGELCKVEVAQMTDSKKVFKAFKEADKPLRAGDVAEITGIDKPEVSKIIKSLQKEGKLISPKRCYYAPS